jgi:hypothetical protein
MPGGARGKEATESDRQEGQFRRSLRSFNRDDPNRPPFRDAQIGDVTPEGTLPHHEHLHLGLTAGDRPEKLRRIDYLLATVVQAADSDRSQRGCRSGDGVHATPLAAR